jgi:hypothetical protein
VLDENGITQGNALFDKGLSDFMEFNLKIAERWKK